MNQSSVSVGNSEGSSLQSDALARIGQIIRNSKCPIDLGHDVAEVVGKWLGASRVGYSRIDPVADTLLTDRDWTAPGVASLAGVLPLRAFGVWIDDLKRDEITRIDDVRLDPRTVGSQALEDRHARSFLNVPIIESGLLAAVFFVNMADVHPWQESEVAFIRDVAERTRTATERLINEAALLRTTEELRALNASLEQRVKERSAALQLYQSIVQSDAAPICAFDRDLRVIAFNPAQSAAFFQIYGYPARLGDVLPDLLLPEQRIVLRGFMERALAGESFVITEEFGLPDLGQLAWEISYNPIRDEAGNVVAAFHRAKDISAHLRAQEELAVFQEALRQSQKMEAVGQLTGGIAHDFNNLLAAISGGLQVIKLKLARGQTEGLVRYADISESSVRRAAALTQRLLAFSRRQTLDPKPVNVNRLVSSMEDLIRRTVGPEIELEVVGAGGLWTTQADPSQLENVLLNLCINSRDAMLPHGGRLTIETANRWLDDRAAAERELPPGQYVSLCVTDTGAGIAPELVKRIFDPFFTTKPTGQGTGLGLSMVYGFARQSGGQIRVYSEVGHGTTMCLYLPRHLGEAEEDAAAGPPAALATGEGETVVIVEDEESIRMLVAEVLDEAGYRVLQAADGPAGLRLLQATGPIALLVSDVGLPGGLNGRQVADAGRVLRPGLKVLFLTGYAENAAVGNGLMETGMQVMTKPFDIEGLTNKVREMLKAEAD